jgi:hypothetical protein
MMFVKQFTYVVEHKIYEKGDIVTAMSKRHSLDVGKQYIVTECFEPKYEGDVVTVFVEGRKTGVDGYGLILFSEYEKELTDIDA